VARSSVAAVIERVRQQLTSAQRWEVDVLDGALDEDDLVIPFTYALPTSVAAGAIIDVGGETMRVMSVDTTALEATVIRGWGGSTAGPHESGETIWINPRFTAAQIHSALIDEITGWPVGLFRVIGATVTVALDVQTVELPVAFANARYVIDVRRINADTESTAWPRQPFRFQRGIANDWTATTITGLFLRLMPPYPSGSLYIEAAVPFDVTGATIDQDLEADYYLTPSLVDLAQLGVRWRLLLEAESGRSQRDAQDTEASAAAVPPMAAAQLAQLVRTVYLARRTEELDRLKALYVTRAG
jgi:hypothetical protein